MQKTTWLVSLILILTSGCMTISPGSDSPCEQKPAFCDMAHPIYLDKTDVVSQTTKRELLDHFVVGQKLCGWDRAK